MLEINNMKYFVTKKGEVMAELKKGANYIMLVDPMNTMKSSLESALKGIPANIQVVFVNHPEEDIKILGIEKVDQKKGNK